MNKYILGVDIGGTFIRIGIVDIKYNRSNLVCYDEYSSNCLSCNSVSNLIQLLDHYIKANKEYKLSGLSIGIPGRVANNNYVASVPRIPGLQNINLGDTLSKVLGMPVYIDRDVNNLMFYDIKKNYLDPDRNKTILGFYIGTGLGNGLWIKGSVHRGRHGFSGELGHIPLYGVDDICTCGAAGCVETRCSGEYLEKLVKEYFPDCMIQDIFVKHREDSRIIQFVKDLAIPIATEIIIIDPDMIIIGGGVVNMKDFPWEILESEMYNRTKHLLPERDIRIIYSGNTNAAGVIGGCIKLFGEI